MLTFNQGSREISLKAYDDLCSFIGYVSILAGIPPGTTPSSANSSISKTYRCMISGISKLALSIDISTAKDRSAKLRHANFVTSFKNQAHLANRLDNSQANTKEAANLISDTKSFIAVFRQLIELDSDESTSSSAISSQQDALFGIQQSRVAAWLDDLSTPLGRDHNSFELLPMQASVPICPDVVSVLENQRNIISEVHQQIENLLEMTITTSEGSALSSSRFLQERQQLLLSTLNSYSALVGNMFNLVDSIDFSAGRSRSKPSWFPSSILYPENTPVAVLSSLYDFVNLKQLLFDGIITINSAIIKCNSGEGLLDALARSLAVSTVDELKPSRDSNEEIIKTQTLETAATIDEIVQSVFTLASGRSDILGRNSLSSVNSMESLSSGNFSHNRARVIGRRESASSFATSAISSNKEDVPWFLKLEYKHELVYDAKRQLKRGTLNAIIERLTQHNALHPTFNTAVLLTFKSFTSPQVLFQELVRRYGIQPPDGLLQEDLNLWKDKKQLPIKQRVANILRKWLDEYWYEDCSTKATKILLASMLSFNDQLAADQITGHDKIRQIIEDFLKTGVTTKRGVKFAESSPASILPRNMKKIKVLDIDPVEMARQLTLRQFKIMEKITPTEVLCRKQRKVMARGGPEEPKFIDAFINSSNELINWVGYVVLKCTDTKKRAQTITYFVNVADQCRQCKNFSSMMAIVSALSSAAIHRLKRTWGNIGSRTHALLDSMNKLMMSTNNFQDYRCFIGAVNPPAIPFLGVFLNDLNAIEDSIDGSPDSANGINMSRRLKMAELIKDFVQYQEMGYNYIEIAPIQVLLNTGFLKAAPIDKQYETSLALEPRERANERMTRLLEETGYL